jgi:hypothetical protein
VFFSLFVLVVATIFPIVIINLIVIALTSIINLIVFLMLPPPLLMLLSDFINDVQVRFFIFFFYPLQSFLLLL